MPAKKTVPRRVAGSVPAMVRLSTIKKNPENPRSIRGEQFERLKKSIKEFPEMMALRPIVTDAAGMTLGGNMRLEALRALGYKEIPGDWVKRADQLTPEQRREFVIKDNSGFGDWDWDGLANEWDDLPLTEWGLDLPEDWKLMEAQKSEDESAVSGMVDRAAELQEKWNVARGQIWQIGRHRLMCGDSTSAEDVGRLMDGRKAALCHADPPYGMGKEADGVANDNLYASKLDAFQMQWWNGARPHFEANASAYIWGNAEDLWRLWYVGGLKDSERLTLRNEIVWAKGSGQGMGGEGARMYPPESERCLFFMLGEQGFSNNTDNYWEGWEPLRSYLAGEAKEMGWGPKDVERICGVGMYGHWFSKSQWVMIPERHYASLQRAAEGRAFKRHYADVRGAYDGQLKEGEQLSLRHEFYASRAYFDNAHDVMTDVWDFPRVEGEERHGHPTPKPVAMIARALKSSAPEGSITYEPFCGAGSTLAAGAATGRTVYTSEIVPEWCAVTLERMSALGMKPKLVK